MELPPIEKLATKWRSETPNWPFWLKVRKIQIWKAVCLSFDREPHNVHVSQSSKSDDPELWAEESNYRFQRFKDREHQLRYEIVLTHVGMPNSFTVVESFENESEGDWMVDLPSFVSWLVKLEFEVPPTLRQTLHHPHAPQTLVSSPSGQECFKSEKIVIEDPSDDLRELVKIRTECYYSDPLNPEKQSNVAARICETLGYAREKNGSPGSIARSFTSVFRPKSLVVRHGRSSQKRKSRSVGCLPESKIPTK